MRRSPRNLRIACDHKGLTHFGGIHFFHKFLQLLQLRDFMARHLSYPRWDEKAGLRRDAVGSQVIDVLEAQEIKETGNEED